MDSTFISHSVYEEEEAKPFSVVPSKRIRGSGHTLQHLKCYTNASKRGFFYCEMVKHWNRLPKRDCEISILGHAQNQTAHGPGQPIPTDLAWVGGVD